MFICHRRGIELDGSYPTYLFVHGHLHAVSPYLSSPNVVWREMGGILVFANLRGGAEYGASWYDAGLKRGKQDIVDDLISAVEWLIANDYTSSSKVAVGGWSAGGKIVGAALVQRPDLFGACLPALGVYDCLRFPRFTVGSAWVNGLGSPDDPEEFSFLRKFSPYHNVKPGTRYPAVYIIVADHDERAFPGHSYKFAAALQDAQAGDKPILVDILRRQGHVGRSTASVIRERTDRWAFLADVLGMDLAEVSWITSQ
jgi:prolyl oligopeptidase